MAMQEKKVLLLQHQMYRGRGGHPGQTGHGGRQRREGQQPGRTGQPGPRSGRRGENILLVKKQDEVLVGSK